MVGLGMALTGACPGTVLVQLATGVQSGWQVLAGGVLGGILYARPRSSDLMAARSRVRGSAEEKITAQSCLGLSLEAGVAAYVVLCLCVVGVATALESAQRPVGLHVHPVFGGVVIGAAQGATLGLTGSAVGVSTGYEVFGQYFWRIVGSVTGGGEDAKSGPKPSVKSLFFAGGIVTGALAFSYSHLAPSPGIVAAADVTASRGVVGGLVMVLGARLAGGCTSGHGISGMSMLGISSFITVACMFAGGIGTAWVMG